MPVPIAAIKGRFFDSGIRWLLRDEFISGDGALNGRAVGALAWDASASWQISSNQVVNMPGLGAEVIVNGDMELDTSWTTIGTVTTNERSNEQAHGGTYSRKIVGNSGGGFRQNPTTFTTGRWYYVNTWFYLVEGSSRYDALSISGQTISNLNAWTRVSLTAPATGTTQSTYSQGRTTPSTYYGDDVSIKPITTADMFAVLATAVSDVFHASVAVAPALQCNASGVVCCLDNTTNPQNYVIGWIDPTGLAYLDKVVGGTRTNLIPGTTALGNSGVRIGVEKNGTAFRLFANGGQIGATQTIADAGIIANTKHGMFSTSPDVALNDFCFNNALVKTLTVLGDSISNDMTPTGDWPGQLAASITPGLVKINCRAASGATILAQMDGQTVAAASDNADVIVILLGVNDGSTTGLQAEYTENLLELAASNPAAHIYGLGVLPTSTQDARRVANNPLIAAACAAAGVTYVNTDGWIDPATDTGDGVHPNAAGSAKVSAQVLALIGAWL